MIQQFKVPESNATLTFAKKNTMHAFTDSSLKIKKVFSRLVMGLNANCSSQETQFDNCLVTMRCKEFTYCLCNFIWPHRSRTFMFVRL
ncbi:hypothetical protein H5410_046679 [Solanum commersonii]|uniref:Uncharacterized protein n=1 Tax=Solanum commersonii TaxID=4109 RepID=A0A9J5XEZ1_SOLCO|nr:hypothetical protein H5410_046679 [Solanum commersonii]